MLSHGIFSTLPLIMPYSRRSRTSRRRPTRRPARRGTTFRRRPYRRPRRTARMSRRRVLNISSEKKQDSRLTFENVSNPALPPVLATNFVPLQAARTYIFPYICTAQDRTGAAPELANYRSRSDVFMRGYKEHVNFQSRGGNWHWRRFCFRLKGNAILNSATTTTPLWQEQSPYGFVRTVTDVNGTGLGAAFTSECFKGQINVDWNNYFTAPLDTNRITVMYDKTRVLKGGNDSPYIQDFKLWHGMNKNFYYRDDENGNTESDSPLHISGTRGMGDYYIVDIISSADTIFGSETVGGITYEGTLYWHER